MSALDSYMAGWRAGAVGTDSRDPKDQDQDYSRGFQDGVEARLDAQAREKAVSRQVRASGREVTPADALAIKKRFQ